MSCENLKKCRKQSWFSRFCRTIFGCTAKKKSLIKEVAKTYTSIATQCQIGDDSFLGKGTILVESKSKLDITVVNNDIYPRTEEFKNSLKKIDNLINTLNDIQALYKNKTIKCGEVIFNSKNEVGDAENTKHVINLTDNFLIPQETSNLSEEELLKFNINFDENTFIQCHTDRGKHSLKIFQNSGHKHFNPLILHRCESELSQTKKNTELGCKSQILNRKSSTELCSQEVSQLQRSYHTLPPRKFSSILNLSLFKSNVIEHMKNIKEDVETLRSIMYSIECLVKKEDRPNLPLYFEEIRKWFSERENEGKCNVRESAHGDLVKLEDSKFVEAKMRATNFCKFYNLTKLNKTKNKLKKYKKY